MPCLTILGTASIQDYVFRSNRLRENLGASGLVANAMQWWRSATNVEVLYIGGGNAALRFVSLESARAGIRDWSRAMLSAAPGLRLVTAHHEYSWGHLAEAFIEAEKKLFEAENRSPRGVEPGALSVVRRCPSTGLAASEKAHAIRREPAAGDADEESDEEEHEPTVWLSTEAQAKRQYFENQAREQFTKRYGAALRAGVRRFRFPIDLGRLGTTPGASQIAIVHADGNGVGRLMTRLIDDHRDLRDDEVFVNKLKALSQNISWVANESFDHLVTELVDAIPALEAQEAVNLRKDRHGNHLLPMRPIVCEGDDLTFVCHGKLALSLAARYLQLFETKSKGDLTASAGVVVMPQKFPFAQAYALVESVCGSAKKSWRRSGGQGSWIDFHLQMEGRTGDLAYFRGSQYPHGERLKLPGRPFCVTRAKDPAWSDFVQAWETCKGWPRSESKRFLETFASGSAEIEALRNRLSDYKKSTLRLPSVETAIIFDALEFLDFHIEWPGK